jgi:hypothetical protein
VNSTTEIDASTLKKIADKPDALVTAQRKKLFDELAKMKMQAGNIDAGTWLEDRRNDRRAGVLQHINDLSDSVSALAGKLRGAAADFTDKDSSNAS